MKNEPVKYFWICLCFRVIVKSVDCDISTPLCGPHRIVYVDMPSRRIRVSHHEERAGNDEMLRIW